MSTSTHRSAGYTAIELLVTIALVGALAAVSLPFSMNMVDDYRLSGNAHDLSNATALAKMSASRVPTFHVADPACLVSTDAIRHKAVGEPVARSPQALMLLNHARIHGKGTSNSGKTQIVAPIGSPLQRLSLPDGLMLPPGIGVTLTPRTSACAEKP